jgi:hypothetical protein
LQEKLELFREQRIIVLHGETEQRIGFPERAAADHDFRPTFGDEIHGGEFLEEANGIDGAEDTDGAGKTNAVAALERKNVSGFVWGRDRVVRAAAAARITGGAASRNSLR